MSNTLPRAPAVAAKLERARRELAEFETSLAVLALEASEGKAGAEKALAAHRSKIEMAETHVSELRRAAELAEQLDREATASATAQMRAGQMREFRSAMAAREKAMSVVLEAAATMARAYGDFAEATLAAAIATPAGTVAPQIAMGKSGVLGTSFGPCEALLLAELWRLAPARKDGAGRFVIPFAKSSPIMTSNDPRGLSAGIDEFRSAEAIVVAEIEKQVEAMNSASCATIEKAA